MTERDEFVVALFAAFDAGRNSVMENYARMNQHGVLAVARVALERAAEVAEERSLSFDFQGAFAECRDQEAGFHNGRLSAARAIRALLPEEETGR